MLIREIINESPDSAMDISDTLMSLKANGITNIGTEQLLSKYNSGSHTMGLHAFVALLQDHPMVMNATLDNVALQGDDLPATKGDVEKNKEVVSKLAANAAKKAIKQ